MYGNTESEHIFEGSRFAELYTGKQGAGVFPVERQHADSAVGTGGWGAAV